MSTQTHILLTGATGYIGGSVLAKLLDHSERTSWTITAIVRSPEKAEKLRTLGVQVVIGSHTDEALVEKLASEADIVMAMADADNLEAARATLRGLKKRYEAVGTPPTLIHTSGTAALLDEANGMYTGQVIYNDTNQASIDSLPVTAAHRHVDSEIVRADQEGYIRSYIVLPSTIYGFAENKLVDLGIQNRRSIQLPTLIRGCIDRKQAGVVGKGENVWPCVHIEDIADVFVRLFDAVRSKQDSIGHGREGYYFAENGEYSFYEVGKKIGELLFEKGIAPNADVVSFTEEEASKYIAFGLGGNSRCKATKARTVLGWKPTKTTRDLLDSLKLEVEASLKA